MSNFGRSIGKKVARDRNKHKSHSAAAATPAAAAASAAASFDEDPNSRYTATTATTRRRLTHAEREERDIARAIAASKLTAAVEAETKLQPSTAAAAAAAAPHKSADGEDGSDDGSYPVGVDGGDGDDEPATRSAARSKKQAKKAAAKLASRRGAGAAAGAGADASEDAEPVVIPAISSKRRSKQLRERMENAAAAATIIAATDRPGRAASAPIGPPSPLLSPATVLIQSGAGIKPTKQPHRTRAAYADGDEWGGSSAGTPAKVAHKPKSKRRENDSGDDERAKLADEKKQTPPEAHALPLPAAASGKRHQNRRKGKSKGDSDDDESAIANFEGNNYTPPPAPKQRKKRGSSGRHTHNGRPAASNPNSGINTNPPRSSPKLKPQSSPKLTGLSGNSPLSASAQSPSSEPTTLSARKERRAGRSSRAVAASGNSPSLMPAPSPPLDPELAGLIEYQNRQFSHPNRPASAAIPVMDLGLGAFSLATQLSAFDTAALPDATTPKKAAATGGVARVIPLPSASPQLLPASSSRRSRADDDDDDDDDDGGDEDEDDDDAVDPDASPPLSASIPISVSASPSPPLVTPSPAPPELVVTTIASSPAVHSSATDSKATIALSALSGLSAALRSASAASTDAAAGGSRPAATRSFPSMQRTSSEDANGGWGEFPPEDDDFEPVHDTGTGSLSPPLSYADRMKQQLHTPSPPIAAASLDSKSDYPLFTPDFKSMPAASPLLTAAGSVGGASVTASGIAFSLAESGAVAAAAGAIRRTPSVSGTTTATGARLRRVVVPSLADLCVAHVQSNIDSLPTLAMLPPELTDRVLEHLQVTNALTGDRLRKFWGTNVRSLGLSFAPQTDWLDFVWPFALERLCLFSCAGVTDSSWQRLLSSAPAASTALTANSNSAASANGLSSAAAASTALFGSTASTHNAAASSAAAGVVVGLPLLLSSTVMAAGSHTSGGGGAAGGGGGGGGYDPYRRGGSPLIHSLKTLIMRNCVNVTNEGLAVVSRLRSLTTLDVSGSDVTNAVLSSFKQLTALTDLSLERCSKLTSAQALMEGLSPLKKLMHLRLSDCTQLPATALEAVSSLRSLRTLRVRNLNLTDKSLRHVRGLTELRHLDMHGVRNISDDALASELKNLDKLESLCVAGTRFGHRFLKVLPAICGRTLTSLHLTQNDNARERDIRACLGQLTALRTLKCRSLYYLTDIALYNCATMPNLTKLDVSECKNLEVTVPMLRAMRRLQHFSARSVAFSEDGFDALGTLTSLQTLDISRCVGPSFGDFGPVLSKLTQLTDLDISFCDLWAVDMEMFLSLKKLTRLRLKGCTAKELDGVKGCQYLSHLTSLTSLNISQTNMRDNELWSFLPFLVDLDWLHIKHSPQLTSAGLLALTALTKLKHLNLEHCDALDDDVLTGSISSLPSITSLDISFIPSLSTNGLVSLRSLHRLTELNLTGCRMTDKALPLLMNMSRLATLRLDGALLSKNGLSSLEELSRRFGTAVRVCQSFSSDKGVMENKSSKKKDKSSKRQVITIGH